jgi:hypothetical protein
VVALALDDAVAIRGIRADAERVQRSPADAAVLAAGHRYETEMDLPGFDHDRQRRLYDEQRAH